MYCPNREFPNEGEICACGHAHGEGAPCDGVLEWEVPLWDRATLRYVHSEPCTCPGFRRGLAIRCVGGKRGNGEPCRACGGTGALPDLTGKPG